MAYREPRKELPGALRTWKMRQALRKRAAQAKGNEDLAMWRRCKAVLEFMAKKPVAQIAEQLDTVRSSVYNWLGAYEASGLAGLETEYAPGAECRLSPQQKEELTEIIERGPVAAGYATGVWTGPMIGDLIRKRYQVRYHNNYVPALLHQLGFSVQRPRKRLARADIEAQGYWLRTKLPAKKKGPPLWRPRNV